MVGQRPNGTGAAVRRPYVVHDRPLFFAHRGGSGLAPENTMMAFQQGMDLGADALELDIQTTRDGEIRSSMMRTWTGQRTARAQWRATRSTRVAPAQRGVSVHTGWWTDLPVSRARPHYSHTARRVRGLSGGADQHQPEREHAGEGTPALGAHTGIWGGKWTLVASGDPHRRLCGSGRYPAGACRPRPALPRIRTFVLAAAVGAAGRLRPAYDALQVPISFRGVPVTRRGLVAAAHRHGLDVHVWTVDRRDAMERLLALGVDGIMTDRPDVLAEVFRGRGWLVAAPAGIR